MNKKLIPLVLVVGSIASIISPTYLFANGHTNAMHTHKSMWQSNIFSQYLIAQGYYSQTAAMQDRRMGIMKFQQEAGINQVWVVNSQTRIAIRNAMKMPNIAETAVSNPIFTTLVVALKAGGLVDTIATGGPFTVFAPTNDAFAKIPSSTLSSLLTPEKKSDLVNILTYHVVSGKALSGDLVDWQEIKTLQGKVLKVKISNWKVFINDAQVVMADVKAKNWVIHVIDSVLLP